MVSLLLLLLPAAATKSMSLLFALLIASSNACEKPPPPQLLERMRTLALAPNICLACDGELDALDRVGRGPAA